MPLDPELEAIFNQDPRFKEVMSQYERNGTSDPRYDPLRQDPEHGGLTDEAIEAYLDRFYQPRNPQFREQFRSGTGAPAPVGGMEDDTGGGGPGTQPPVPPSPPVRESSQGGPAPVPAPSPEAPPVPAPTPDAGGAPVDPFRGAPQTPEFDPARIAAWQDFDRQLRTDPRLQAILYNYATTGVVPEELTRPQPPTLPPVSGAGGVPPASPAPDLTPPPDLDMADPAVRALWDRMVASEQARQQQLQEVNQRLAQINSRVDTTSAEFQARTQAENEGLVQRVVSSFAHEKGIDANEANRILRIAENLGVAQHYMTGVDPITLMPVRPEPMAAVERALEVAYNQDPIAQERERQRWQAAEQTRQRMEQERRRKLAGVGGGSGQAPRAVQEPQSKEDRTGAAVEYLRGIMYGEGVQQ